MTDEQINEILRAVFAAAALAGRMVNGTPTTYMAKECWDAADLMLEARGAKENG